MFLKKTTRVVAHAAEVVVHSHCCLGHIVAFVHHDPSLVVRVFGRHAVHELRNHAARTLSASDTAMLPHPSDST